MQYMETFYPDLRLLVLLALSHQDFRKQSMSMNSYIGVEWRIF